MPTKSEKIPVINETLKAKDFASNQEVRWCPGCGDYAILKAMQKTLATVGAKPETTVFVAGIGCSSRFPYYMSTYGFHTIHGRAPAFATGIKLANPGLDVWVITGDGDGLSIGGNHLLHSLRRNINLQIVLFNNEIYGLTKGQYSPTSRVGTRSPSSPSGSIESPISACSFALAAGASFVARSIDTSPRLLPKVLQRSYQHNGASFVEIYQNCIVYNDKVFADFLDKDISAERQLHLAHGEPMLYGTSKSKGIRVSASGFSLELVIIGKEGVTEDDILVHDETNKNLAQALVNLDITKYPVPLGVIYATSRGTYDELIHNQIGQGNVTPLQRNGSARGKGVNELLHSGTTWEVN